MHTIHPIDSANEGTELLPQKVPCLENYCKMKLSMENKIITYLESEVGLAVLHCSVQKTCTPLKFHTE